MLRQIGKAWRVFATGLSFAVFGVGGLLLQLIAVPLLYLLFPLSRQRQKMARRAVHGMFWLFVRFMCLLGALRFRFHRGELLRRRGLIIVANHPTLLDVVFLLSAAPDATCIIRAGLANNPFTGAVVRMAGYVRNDWGVEIVDACVDAVRAGSSLIIFPEGTRTNATQPHHWHRGAAHIALRAGMPLTPVRIRCEPPSLRKGEPWWQVPARRMRYSIDVLEDVPVADRLSHGEKQSDAARGLTQQLQELLALSGT